MKDLKNKIFMQHKIEEFKFLANSMHEEFSDADLDRLNNLCDFLMGWHEEGLKAQTELKSNASGTFVHPSDVTATDAKETTPTTDNIDTDANEKYVILRSSEK